MSDHIDHLISLFLLTPAAMSQNECEELSRWLIEDDGNASRYIRESLLHRSVHDVLVNADANRQAIVDGSLVPTGSDGEIFDRTVWQSLAKHEQTAEPLASEKPQGQPEPQPQHPEKHPARKTRRSDRLSLVAASVSIAAILLICLYVQLFTRPVVEVATVVDTYGAQLKGPALNPWGRLTNTSSPSRLEAGVLQIEFDGGARVVIEAPAQFRLDHQGRMTLQSGRLYARVPPQARGFTVETPFSEVIDLGTEFGVRVGQTGASDVHMIKGRASLSLGRAGMVLDLPAGQAARIGQTGSAQEIPLEETAFVRDFSSDRGTIWRGGDICLADVVGGGGGFGSGVRGSYIDVADGKWHPNSGLSGGEELQGQTLPPDYRPVLSNAYIDGIFVPDGRHAPVLISSSGHLFPEAPQTSGRCWYGVISWNAAQGRTVMLDGVLYGTPDNPALLMHANVGITFDLQAIRRDFPDQSITEFVSVYGIAESYARKDIQPYADFWVLVDGQVRFSRRDVTIRQTSTVRVNLADSDRFVTLIATEGSENTLIDDKGPNFNDWCIWGQPVLKLQ